MRLIDHLTNSRPGSALAAGAIALGVASGAHADIYDLRVVAKTGDAAPGAAGGDFQNFGLVSLNASGQVAFTASTTGAVASTGMWVTPISDIQSLDLLVGADLAVPSMPPGAFFDDFDFSFYHPQLTDDGNIGFAAPIQGLGTSVFRCIDGAVTVQARPGMQVPGMALGVVYDSVGNLVCYNANDLLAFRAVLTGTGIDDTNDGAIMMNWFGGIQMVLREGGGVPGMPGTTWGQSFTPSVQIADNGRLAFLVPLEGATDVSWSYWSGWPGALDLVAKAGDLSPTGAPFGASSGSFWGFAQAQSGSTFYNTIDVGGQWKPGVWYSDGNAIEAVAYEGMLGPLGFYEDFEDGGATAGDGTIVLRANGAFPGILETEDSGIIRKSPGADAVIVAREGDQPHGMPAGVEFDEFQQFEYGPVAVDDQHRTYFAARLRGPGIGGSNDSALFVTEADGTEHVILHEGQWLDLGNGPRQVASFIFTDSIGTHAGRRPGVNDRGDLAIRLVFTDASQAVVVAQLPPSCPGDVDHDGDVDFDDLLLVLATWNQSGGIGDNGDADLDGDVDFNDLLVVLGNWGNTCT